MNKHANQNQVKCQQCKGYSAHYAELMNLRTKEKETHWVSCKHPTCKNGYMDKDLQDKEYRQTMSWGSRAA